MLKYLQLTFLEALSIDVPTVSVTQPFLESSCNKHLELENGIVLSVVFAVAVLSMPAIKPMLLTVALDY